MIKLVKRKTRFKGEIIFKDSNSIVMYNDCLEAMKKMPDNHVTGILTDPPYGLSFMGKGWDHGVPGVPFWKEALRIAKPGAFLLAFGGTRTHHRLMCAIEDAGWEIRDCCMYLHGQGFPKSYDISKGVDKNLGNERKVIKQNTGTFGINKTRKEQGYRPGDVIPGETTEPISVEGLKWQGYGTALKPAWEPIIVAMKPVDKNYVHNALTHGLAGLNIDACRVEVNPEVDDMLRTVVRKKRISETWEKGSGFKNETNSKTGVTPQGRFPANLILDEEAGEILDEQSGILCKAGNVRKSQINDYNASSYKMGIGKRNPNYYKDSGKTSRFFYCAKASKKERGEYNKHPTVKPLALMTYLVKLISPPKDGIILDPFMGSGTTLLACRKEGRKCIGIDNDIESCITAKRRIEESK